MKARDWFQAHASDFSGQLSFGELLSRHTYYRIGGPATVFAIPKSLEDIQWLARGIAETGIRFFILGLGSNLLVSDEGFDGLIVRASRINLEIGVRSLGGEVGTADSSGNKAFGTTTSGEKGNLGHFGDRLLLRTGASVAISSLLRRAAQEGWQGLEFLTGIPGSIGGAVTMNAGTHLGETQSRLRRVEVFSLAGKAQGESVDERKGEMLQHLPTDAASAGPAFLKVFEGNQLQFEYRKNLFLNPSNLIWAAEWEVNSAPASEVKALIDQTLARRKASQPIDYPSCGSVFKNPKSSGLSAWQVIDRLGLRGHRIGDAQFAEKHSNFIINLGHAKASDVRALIDLAKSRAEKELGIHLQEEVIALSRSSPPFG